MKCQRLCSRSIRPMGTSIIEHPNTVSQALPGVCTPCYKLGRRQSSKAAQTIANTPANRESLAAYLRWRAPYRQEAGTQ